MTSLLSTRTLILREVKMPVLHSWLWKMDLNQGDQTPEPISLSNTAPSCPYEWITTVRNVLSLLPRASFSLRSKYTRERPNSCTVTWSLLEDQTSIFFPNTLLLPVKWPSQHGGLVQWKSTLSFLTLGTPLDFSFLLSSLPHSKHLF